MPYHRRYGKRRSRRKWGSVRGGVTKRMGGKRYGGGKRDRSACLGGRKPEKKFLDVAVAAYDPGTAGTVKLMSDIVQGVTASTRVGRRATILSLHLTGQILPPINLIDDNAMWNRMKVWVIQDLQTNGALFAVTDFLASADIDSFRNLNQKDRFKVLFTRQYSSNPHGVSGNGTTHALCRGVIPFKANVKCCIPVDYNAADGDIDSQQLNSLHVLAISEVAAPATTIAYNTRIRYVD